MKPGKDAFLMRWLCVIHPEDREDFIWGLEEAIKEAVETELDITEHGL